MTTPDDGLRALASQLDAHDDYRVLRRLLPVARYGAPRDPANVRRAIVLDVETTGLSQTTDVIIELGLIVFSYDKETGAVLDVISSESWLDDPGRAIPDDVVRLTGITNDEVRGQRIDAARVRELSDGVALFIAHNASFDRPFIDRKFPFLADRHWGCSMNDVPWRDRNIGSHKLDYLLYTHANAFLDTHHRALDDCRATLHVLATAFADARTPMALLLANCRQQRSRVSAIRSPYETKDVLRKRGYSWSGESGTPPKVWCREVATADVAAELLWLREHVYANGSAEPTVDKVDLRRRYAL
jgi:DNA polymerase-3 subunit epsilon